MKIRDLKKGMLLEVANDNECFTIQGRDDMWLRVIPTPKKYYSSGHWQIISTKSKIAMYLGTKSDLGIAAKWTNKFVLIDNKVVGVDPASWRKIKIVD